MRKNPKWLRFSIAVTALLVPSTALAESCKVQNSNAAGQWKFVRVYDADTGQVVLRQAINGGDSKDVTVSGTRARVEYKLAGDAQYHSATIGTCKAGSVLKT
jgi:hypothetical protein